MINYDLIYHTDLNGNLPIFSNYYLGILNTFIFRKDTCIIMDFDTWRRIPSISIAKNILVLTTSTSDIFHKKANSVEKCYEILNRENYKNIYLLGNAITIREFLKSDKFELIRIKHFIDSKISNSGIKLSINWEEYGMEQKESNVACRLGFETIEWVRREDEAQYLNLINKILLYGDERDDRTGNGVIGTWGNTMRFSLRHNKVPLLTTKKIYVKGVIEELLWFISADTSSKTLEKKGVNIWKDNATKEFLENRGLDYEEGELGPIYGHQWRKWGSEYGNEESKGIDQLSNVINLIKNDPTSRRIVLSSWNVSDLDKMALPPCHTLCQFSVRDGGLSCVLYQRSGDIGLGVPFNIASYSILTHLLAFHCGLRAHEFVHVISDTHVYKNHIQALNEQVKRTPGVVPTLEITEKHEDISNYRYENFIVHNYEPQAKIPMKMAI